MCLGFALNSDPGVHGPLLEADLIAPQPSATDYDSVIRRFNGSLPRFYNFLTGKSLLNCRPASRGGEGRTVFFQFYRFVETQMWVMVEFARSWRYSFIRDMSPRFGAKIQLLTLSTDTLI